MIECYDKYFKEDPYPLQTSSFNHGKYLYHFQFLKAVISNIWKVLFISFLDSKFWCWSRKDYSEDFIKNVNISTTFSYDDKVTKPFTSSFEKNGTKIRCNSGQEWAQNWTETRFAVLKKIPCITTTFPVATFLYMKEYPL